MSFEACARAAIPSTVSRRTPYPLDRAAYKRRNVIERMFCKLKNWRERQAALDFVIDRAPRPAIVYTTIVDEPKAEPGKSERVSDEEL